MPELPEVESVRRNLLDASPSLIGNKVESVFVLRASVIDGMPAEQFADELTGAIFRDILRHGKYLFFRFDPARGTKSRWMALHLRMTGRLFLVPSASAAIRHTRFYVNLGQDLTLRFDDPRAFGRVWLLDDPAEVTAGLGPDALTVSRSEFLCRLASSRRQLKPLLLDQSFIAGVGNIYADETLFRAGLHPLRNSADLIPAECDRLFEIMHEVMEQAVTCQGANIDGVFEAGNFPVAVYGRTGKPCQVCGTAVVKFKIGQRGTHLCPVCQPLN